MFLSSRLWCLNSESLNGSFAISKFVYFEKKESPHEWPFSKIIAKIASLIVISIHSCNRNISKLGLKAYLENKNIIEWIENTELSISLTIDALQK